MLKRRLIPKLQLGVQQSYRGLRPVLLVTREFASPRAIGDPISQAKIYEAQLADELILVDITRTAESWPVLLNTIEKASAQLATPLSVGGGVRSFEQVQQLLDRGADKIVLNSGAIDTPELIDQISSTYGSQCVVLSIDVGYKIDKDWSVITEGGTKESQLSAMSWACEAVNRGAGEILLTSIMHDGKGQGLDLELIKSMTAVLRVPIIASGGCGLAQHFVDGYYAGASAVASGTYFCLRDQNPMQCRSHIHNSGIPIRTHI